MLGTDDKAARVLGLFTPASPDWGVTETAQALGVSRSAAHDRQGAADAVRAAATRVSRALALATNPVTTNPIGHAHALVG